MKVEKQLITPQLGEVLLSNNKLNRPVDIRNEKFIYNQMMDDTFLEDTGEAIKISKSGNILDGQHRLRALVRANKSYNLLIISDLEDSIFPVLDTGKKRSAKDVLHINGFKSGGALASIARTIKILESPNPYLKLTYAITNSEVLNFVKDNEELYEIFRFCENISKKFKAIPFSHLGALYYILQKKGHLPERIDKFLQLYSTGYELKPEDPIMVLRNKLIQDGLSKSKLSPQHKLALLIQTWNNWVKGKPCYKLPVPDTFPKPI